MADIWRTQACPRVLVRHETTFERKAEGVYTSNQMDESQQHKGNSPLYTVAELEELHRLSDKRKGG